MRQWTAKASETSYDQTIPIYHHAVIKFQDFQRHNGPGRGLSSAYKSYLFRSYHKFKQKSWSNFIFSISTKRQLQNLDQTPACQKSLKFEILTKPSFRISTEIQLHNIYKTSAAKYWPNTRLKILLELKILTKPCVQSLNKSLALWPNIGIQICIKLLPTRSSSSTLATVITSTSFELASPQARTNSTKRYGVSQSVS